MSANASNDSFSTPKQTKRLGLRRSSSILRDKKATGSVIKTKTLEITTPAGTPKSRLPQSDVKISYKNLEERNESNSNHTPVARTPATPENPSSSCHWQRLAVSTNCRPYRLALSRKVREKMTKKRLEFFLANELDKDGTKEEIESKEEELNKQEIMPNTKEDLKQQIELARNELKSRQEHKKKVLELQEAIKVWKRGFSSALLDLQQKLEPRLDAATLLRHLQLPQEMLKYIDEE